MSQFCRWFGRIISTGRGVVQWGPRVALSVCEEAAKIAVFGCLRAAAPMFKFAASSESRPAPEIDRNVEAQPAQSTAATSLENVSQSAGASREEIARVDRLVAGHRRKSFHRTLSRGPGPIIGGRRREAEG
jgi:hypothetical protein